MVAVVNILGKVRKGWPAIGMAGKYWAITFPVSAGGKKWIDAPFVCITHQPTGFKAAEVWPENAQRVANRFARLFGRARTAKGVMRKFNELPPTMQKWVKSQRYWRGR